MIQQSDAVRKQERGAAGPSSREHRVVILGAGRPFRKETPSALVPVGPKNRILDWLQASFAVLSSARLSFVGGYKAGLILNAYPNIQFFYNENWAFTGPVQSLSLVPLAPGVTTYVSYADIVFRPATVERMEAIEADVVVAVDTLWRVRYEGRSPTDIDIAEKVRCDGDRLLEIGRRLDSERAHAEFVGLLKLSAQGTERLQWLLASGTLGEHADIPQMIQAFLEEGTSVRILDVRGDWAELNAPQDLARFVLGTKAESLERLKPLVKVGQIGRVVTFTHQQWNENRSPVLRRIQEVFPHRTVIVRSSAVLEDTWLKSSAGVYKSVADVSAQQTEKLVQAVEQVLGSYGEPQPDNQVFVQEMLQDVAMSGVVMTRTHATGAPYYVINFDETPAQTDAVTSGRSDSTRTVYLFRAAALRPGLPAALQQVLEAVQELEGLVGHDSLDVEFACTRDGGVHILQVRPLLTAQTQKVDDAKLSESLQDAARLFRERQPPSPFMLGRFTSLSVMTDWNPAEMIGTKPKRLAFSLYRELITDEVWARQRAEYGYRDVRPCPLLVDLCGQPFVDVRAVFNSFVPAALPEPLARRLVEHDLRYLARHPELHDKVEFDVLRTCFTFDFDPRAAALREAGFTEQDLGRIRAALLELTRNGMARCAGDVESLQRLEQRFESVRAASLPPLERAFLWLEDAKQFGVLPFAHLARAAFVATSLLRSLCEADCISPKQMEAFQSSLRTVPSRMQDEAHQVATGQMPWERFVALYGHLRPGTYDITSACYASAPEEYLRPMVEAAAKAPASRAPFRWEPEAREAMGRALEQSGLRGDPETLERFLRQAMEGREFSKFLFTRNLSAALEALAQFGTAHDISREELAHVRIGDLLDQRTAQAEEVARRLQRAVQAGQEAYGITQEVCLPGQIFSETDFHCFEQLKAQPNFVTRKKVRARAVVLSAQDPRSADLSGAILLIESADPGFDWIFSRKIEGLVTMYGGANSHMAVRAGEFQLPAAIGAGELLYQKLSQAQTLELDCGSRQIHIVR